MAFKDGALVFSQPGALPAAALEQLIAAVRELDIDAALRSRRRRDAEERLMSAYTLAHHPRPCRTTRPSQAVRDGARPTRASAS